MDNLEKRSSFYMPLAAWTVAVFVAVILILLFVSWRIGMSPFTAESLPTASSENQVAQKDVLDSLTATSSPKERISEEVLSTLSAKANGTKSEAVPQDVLDSLTAPGK